MRVTVLLVVAVAVVGCVYGDTLGAGLIWEDYTKLRPATLADVAAAFHGSWDWSGRWPAYYRPLSVAYDALAAFLFGLNAPALHAISLAELSLNATLAGLVVARELRSTASGAGASAAYAAHPFVALTAGPWFYLQFQLLAAACVLAAVLVWQQRPRETVRDWWPIAIIALAGFLIKEDALMVLPGLIAVQMVRARMLGDMRPPKPAVLVSAAIFVAMLLAVRVLLLGGWGGESVADFATGALNLVRGPVRVLGRFRGMFFEHTAAMTAASVFFAGSLIAGLAALWRGSARARGLWLLGGVLGATCDLPLFLASNNTRYYLLVFCAVFMLVASLHALMRALPPAARAIVPIAGLAGLLAMGWASRDALAPLRPCAPGNLFADREMLERAPLPDAIRNWLVDKPAACASGRYRELFSTAGPIVWK